MKITAKVDWERVRELLYAILRDNGLRSIIKWVVTKTAAGAGFKAWLIKEIAEHLYDEIGEPIVKAVLAKAGYLYTKVEGSVIVKKIEEAKNENNQSDYDSNMDDIFN